MGSVLEARALAFFSRVARLTSSGTGVYSHSRSALVQLRHGAPPQHLILLSCQCWSPKPYKIDATHRCRQYWHAIEMR